MKKLLIVDDSSFMRQIIKNAIKDLKIQVIEASNGKEAIDCFKREKPDLVTMDIVMPQKTGIEALKEILKENECAKVVICSSMVNERTDIEAKEAGATAFIKKPFKDKDFKEMVVKHI